MIRYDRFHNDRAVLPEKKMRREAGAHFKQEKSVQSTNKFRMDARDVLDSDFSQ